MHSKKTAFIVEHDFIMASYLADRVIVYDGQASKEATARAPQSLQTGMNAFLKNLGGRPVPVFPPHLIIHFFVSMWL